MGAWKATGGRAGWVAAVILASVAGASLGMRQQSPRPRLRPGADGYVVPAGLVANANTDRGGTDNAAAIQAALDTGLPVRLPPGRYGVGKTLDVSNFVGRDLGGVWAGNGGPDNPGVGAWLVWQGPRGGTLLRWRGMKGRLHDLGMACAKSTSLDRCVDVEKPDRGTLVSTEHLFSGLAFDGRFGAVRCGLVAGEDGSVNGEFMRFESCTTRYCTYAGVSVPNATRQAKNWLFQSCTFGGPGEYGVVWNSGSADFYHCNFDALGCGVAWFGGSHEPVTFAGCTGERCKRLIQATGVVNLNLLGCRLNLIAAANPQPFGKEFVSGGSNWAVTGCVFEEADSLKGFLRPGDGASVVVQACQFHSAQPFPADDRTRFRLVCQGVRVSSGNNLLPEGGSYWQRNVPGVSYAGGGLLLSDGHWPPKGSYSGGVYVPGPGEAKLYLDSGKLWLSVGGKAPVALPPAAAP